MFVVPGPVSGVSAVAYPYAIRLSWASPAKANGVIVQYIVSYFGETIVTTVQPTTGKTLYLDFPENLCFLVVGNTLSPFRSLEFPEKLLFLWEYLLSQPFQMFLEFPEKLLCLWEYSTNSLNPF